MNDPRGSVWSIWDLHIHTPGTKLSDNYGGNNEKNWNKFIQILEDSKVSTFGITDYFSIDGYKYLINKKKHNNISHFPHL